MRVFFAILVSVFLGATLAEATPGRITTSDDRMVAATQSHLYVVRDIVDNLGSHYVEFRDQHLIEIGLDNGEATRTWPLRRMYVNHLATDEFQVPGQVTEQTGETFDMFAILAELGAAPLMPNPWAVEDLSIKDGALVQGEELQVLSPFGLRAAGRAQLGILRDTYPPIETEEDYRKADRIDFYDLYAEGDWACDLQPEGHKLYRATDALVIAKLFCEDWNLTGTWSFHVIVEENPEN